MDIVKATEGNDGVVLGKMLADTGLVTYDPGYVSTGSCESAITYIDGGNGILRHRGYPIEQLAEKATFNEVSYMLINGELPTKEQLEKFNYDIRHHTLLDEDFKKAFSIFPRGAHPMATLASSVNILSAYYQDELDPSNPEQRELATARLMAKVPMLAAYAYRASKGQPYLYPDNSLNARENPPHDVGYPSEKYEVARCSSTRSTILILHADHEQNCSTRPCAWSPPPGPTCSSPSPRASTPYPLHGGANQAVLRCSRHQEQPRRYATGGEPRHEQGAGRPPDGLRPPRKSYDPRRHRQEDRPRPQAPRRRRAGPTMKLEDRAGRRLLCSASSTRTSTSHRLIYRAMGRTSSPSSSPSAAFRLDRSLQRAGHRPGLKQPSPPDLHRRERARLHPARAR